MSRASLLRHPETRRFRQPREGSCVELMSTLCGKGSSVTHEQRKSPRCGYAESRYTPRQIPRPAGKSAGLRDDAVLPPAALVPCSCPLSNASSRPKSFSPGGGRDLARVILVRAHPEISVAADFGTLCWMPQVSPLLRDMGTRDLGHSPKGRGRSDGRRPDALTISRAEHLKKMGAVEGRGLSGRFPLHRPFPAPASPCWRPPLPAKRRGGLPGCGPQRFRRFSS